MRSRNYEPWVSAKSLRFRAAKVFVVIRTLRAEQTRRARVFDDIVAAHFKFLRSAYSVTHQVFQAHKFTSRFCQVSKLVIVDRWPRHCRHFDGRSSTHLSGNLRQGDRGHQVVVMFAPGHELSGYADARLRLRTAGFLNLPDRDVQIRVVVN